MFENLIIFLLAIAGIFIFSFLVPSLTKLHLNYLTEKEKILKKNTSLNVKK